MYPTIKNGEIVLIKERDYLIEQGDIVLIKYKESESLPLFYPHNKYLLKRVIGVGGNTVEISHIANSVYVDGIRIDEPYINYYDGDTTIKKGEPYTIVPAGYIYVLGDNRNNSFDSRNPELGLVSEDDVVGIVMK